MTILLEAEFPRTLDALLARFAGARSRGLRVDAWLFEDAVARHAGEAALAARGVQARLRSAYKPLLHWLREEVDIAGLAAIEIGLPTHPDASPGRFQLEAFPLAGLLAGVAVSFVPGDAALDYRVALRWRDGREAEASVFAPNLLRRDPMGAAVLGCAGWLRVWHPGELMPIADGTLESEFEAVYAAAMRAVAAQDWGTALPCFETLEIAVATGGIERPLGYGEECASTREALHEELYFSLIELFQHRFGRPPDDRRLQPGQIIPDIQPGDGATTLRVTIGPPAAVAIGADAGLALTDADAPLSPDRVAAELAGLGGAAFGAVSVQGRAVPAAYFAGAGPGMVVSAGQHANETSGVVGALRAAPALIAAGTHFALIPQENADGYALHHRLRAAHPRHIHHAARYSALGDDVQARAAPPWHEAAARREAFARTAAVLHVNLHGYPAHEWTRPLNGYVPRGFAAWTVPKGFFLIVRHRPGLEKAAAALIGAVAARVALVPGLAALNARQIADFRAHAGDLGAPVIDGVACFVSADEAAVAPLTLITEYPDETVYGAAFRLAHAVQCEAVLAAAAWLRVEGRAI